LTGDKDQEAMALDGIFKWGRGGRGVVYMEFYGYFRFKLKINPKKAITDN